MYVGTCLCVQVPTYMRLSMCVNVFVSVGALWMLVCMCVHVRVVMCVLLFNQQYEHKISNILSFDSCNMHITVHPSITVSSVNERHLSNTVYSFFHPRQRVVC